MHYVAQIKGFDSFVEEYLVQPYTQMTETKEFTFKMLENAGIENYGEDDSSVNFL